jgi:pre-mRNA branch site protein p14
MLPKIFCCAFSKKEGKGTANNQDSMPDARILLVANFRKKLGEGNALGENLYKLFQGFGPIRQVRVGSTAETKGSAIVVFDYCESADAAVGALHNYSVGGTLLRVTVFDEARDKKAIERRKRERELDAEYREHLKQTSTSATASV